MRELRDAIRQWARTPVITVVVVLSLALGIGANTAIFSLIDSLLIRPLPVRAPDSLVRIGATRFPYHGVPVWRRINDSGLFESTAAMSLLRPDISETAERQSALGLAVSGTFFDTLGVGPAIGRLLTTDDDRIGTPLVAVVDYELWQSRYHGRAEILGATIRLDGKPFTIVGVTPRGFFGLNVGRRFDVATSLNGYDALYPNQLEEVQNSFSVVARLKPGQSRSDAERAVRELQSRALPAASLLERLRGEWNLSPAAAGLMTTARDQYRKPLAILMALAALVLVIASVNVANLLLARCVERRGELAVRLSLGASRWSLMRGVLLESLVIAVAGAIVAIVIGAWTARAIVNGVAINQSGILATWIDVPLNLRVLAFTIAAGVSTALVFGAGPAWRTIRVEPLEAMRQRARGTIGGGSRLGIAQILLGLQVALAFMLVLGGGLLIKSFIAMTTQDLGFDRRNIVVAVPDFSRSSVARRERVVVSNRLRERLQASAGIQDVALVESTPFGLGTGSIPFGVDGNMPDDSTRVTHNRISAGYWRALGIPLKAGRDFEGLGRESRQVAIVNEAFASRYYAGRSALGQSIRLGLGGKRQVEVIGVAGNTRQTSLRDNAEPTLYVPFFPDDEAWLEIDIRSTLPEPQVRAAVLAILQDVAPDASVEFRSIETGVRYTAARDRVVASLAGGFGVLALLLAAIGLYGVITQQVIQRRQEFGVRVAIGAAPASVTRMILRQACLIIAAGLIVGLASALASSRLITALLFEVSPSDPLSIAAAAIFLSVVTLLAAWIPARHASRIDPMTALREE
jgi:putative ABC transport system permease protein